MIFIKKWKIKSIQSYAKEKNHNKNALSSLGSKVGKAERRRDEAWNSFVKFLGLEAVEEEVKDSGGLCRGLLKIVLIINQIESLIWVVGGVGVGRRGVEQF